MLDSSMLYMKKADDKLQNTITKNIKMIFPKTDWTKYMTQSWCHDVFYQKTTDQTKLPTFSKNKQIWQEPIWTDSAKSNNDTSMQGWLQQMSENRRDKTLSSKFIGIFWQEKLQTEAKFLLSRNEWNRPRIDMNYELDSCSKQHQPTDYVLSDHCQERLTTGAVVRNLGSRAVIVRQHVRISSHLATIDTSLRHSNTRHIIWHVKKLSLVLHF